MSEYLDAEMARTNECRSDGRLRQSVLWEQFDPNVSHLADCGDDATSYNATTAQRRRDDVEVV